MVVADRSLDEYILRVFGAAAYPDLIVQPVRLLIRAAELAGEREAEQRLALVQDLSLAAGLKLGQKYVDPNNPSAAPAPGQPYHTLTPLRAHEETLQRRAYPWMYSADAVQARREAEEERRWQEAEQVFGRGGL